MNPNHKLPVLCYFVAKPYIAFWVCVSACAVYILGSMVYVTPALVSIVGPFVLILMAVTWPLVRDLVRLTPKLIVGPDRIVYEGWPFKEIDLRNIKKAYVASLASRGASRIHLEVINEDELLKAYGFIPRLILRGHGVSGDTPIVISLTTLRKVKSEEVVEAINTRIAVVNSAA